MMSVPISSHACHAAVEIPWMLEMTRRFGDKAKRKDICMVHGCGFDSIPADLTTFLIVDYVKKQLKGYGPGPALHSCQWTASNRRVLGYILEPV